MRIVLAALCAAFVLGFIPQDRAKPRDQQRRDPPASHPRAGGDAQKPPPVAQPAPNPPKQPNATPDRSQSQAKRRHPQPSPGGSVAPDPGRRHPRPGQDHLWRRQEWRWQSWQYNWWYGPQDYAWFPYRYPPGWYFEFHLFGHRYYSRDPIWHPDEQIWFYWPFRDAPPLGCDWYWVPTHRTQVFDPAWGWRWKYWDWQYVYFCID